MSDDSRIEDRDPVSSAGPPGSMKRKLAAGAGWMTALQLASRVIEVGFIAVLARILFPADFGVIAGATIFIQFATLLVDIGIGATIVQIPGLTRNDIRTAGTLVALNGLGYFLLAQLFAPLAGSFMRMEALTDVIRVLALVFIVQSFGIVPENLLVRRLDARRVMIAQLVARVVGTGGVGILLAWAGWGYWSLVAATLAEATFKALWLIAIVRPPMRPLLTREGAKRLMRRGAGFSVAQVINFFALRANNVVVGRTMDAAALGLYSRAFNLMSVPSDLYSRIAERLVFPAMAQVQDDPVRLRSAFLRGTELTAVVGMPMSALLAVLAPEIIDFILGNRWAAVIGPFAILCAASYFRLGAKIGGSLQRAKAATGAMITNQIVYATMIIGGALIAYPYGINAVAVSGSLAVVAFYGIVNFNACRIAGVSLGDFVGSHGNGALVALLVTVCVFPVVLLLRQADAPTLVKLCVTGAVLAVVGLILFWQRPRWLLGEFVVSLLDSAAKAVGRIGRRRSATS
ncbi:hypothetical protein DMC47_20470 [Nostoc sp. 3335mG]|nr:hypothetical protein DMC47_20470 [Nostoc sp. 3335mG]